MAAAFAAVTKVSDGKRMVELGRKSSFACFEDAARAEPHRARAADKRGAPEKVDSETEAGKIARFPGDE